MRDELRNTDTLREVEESLAALKPRPSGIDRDQFLFLAGAAQTVRDQPTSPRRWFWPSAAVLSFAAAVVFGGLYRQELSSEPKVRIVYVETSPGRQPIPRHEGPVAAVKPRPSSRDISTRKNPLQEMPPPNVEVTQSKLVRSRHHILVTDVDRLPDATGGNRRNGSPQSYRTMSLTMVGRVNEDLSSTSTTPGFRLFRWALPSQQKDRL